MLSGVDKLTRKDAQAVRAASRNLLAGCYLSRSNATRASVVQLLSRHLADQPDLITTLAELRGHQTFLDALDGAGLRPYGIGDNDSVLLLSKTEQPRVGETLSVYQGGVIRHIKIVSVRSLGPVGAPPPAQVIAPAPAFDLCGLIAGEKLKPVLETVRKVSRFDMPIVVTGETGTGKEMIARIIHQNGARGGKPWVAINCSAIPETLIESELFGHERGAFTGSAGRRRGVFEQADQGTLFLDEVGDMSLSTQVKLLRVLQDGEFRRVGGEQPVKTNVRLICATNKNLPGEIRAGRFREDLYHRICVVDIRVPALRERSKEEILLLAGHFLSAAARNLGKSFTGFSAEARDALVCCSWQGNVREMQNRITQAAVMSAGEEIAAADLNLAASETSADSLLVPLGRLAVANGWQFWQTLGRLEKPLLTAALEKSGGNRTVAAQLLGLQPRSFYRILHRNGL